MKEIRFTKIISLILLLFCNILAPFLCIDTQLMSLLDIIQKNSNIQLVFVIIIENLLLFLLLFLFLFIKNRRAYIFLLLFSSFLFMLLFFFPYLYSVISGVDIQIVSLNIAPFIFIVISIICIFYSLRKIFMNINYTISDIVEIGLYVALAIILDLSIFKIKINANGGSISFAMFPLIVLVLRKGFAKGFVSCGVIFGFINCLIDGYGLHTFPLDYFIGFGAMAIIGLFKTLIQSNSKFKKIIFLTLSILVAGFIRLMAATLSGIIFYQFNFIQSLIYQLTYIGPSLAVSLALILIFNPFLEKLNKRYK